MNRNSFCLLLIVPMSGLFVSVAGQIDDAYIRHKLDIPHRYTQYTFCENSLLLEDENGLFKPMYSTGSNHLAMRMHFHFHFQYCLRKFHKIINEASNVKWKYIEDDDNFGHSVLVDWNVAMFTPENRIPSSVILNGVFASLMTFIFTIANQVDCHRS